MSFIWLPAADLMSGLTDIANAIVSMMGTVLSNSNLLFLIGVPIGIAVLGALLGIFHSVR